MKLKEAVIKMMFSHIDRRGNVIRVGVSDTEQAFARGLKGFDF